MGPKSRQRVRARLDMSRRVSLARLRTVKAESEVRSTWSPSEEEEEEETVKGEGEERKEWRRNWG